MTTIINAGTRKGKIALYEAEAERMNKRAKKMNSFGSLAKETIKGMPMAAKQIKEMMMKKKKQPKMMQTKMMQKPMMSDAEIKKFHAKRGKMME